MFQPGQSIKRGHDEGKIVRIPAQTGVPIYYLIELLALSLMRAQGTKTKHREPKYTYDNRNGHQTEDSGSAAKQAWSDHTTVTARTSMPDRFYLAQLRVGERFS